MIEDGFVVADVVERSELGRVQKSAAAEAVEGQEISDFRGAQAQPEGTSDGAERAVGRIQVAKRPRRSQAGARGDIGHQAGLVAKLRIHRPRHHFHALDGADRKLRGEDFALLIADGLSVDHEAGLRVIAERVEQSVAVGGHAARAIRDRLAETASGVERENLGKLRSIGVHVIGGIELQQVRARRLHGDTCLAPGDFQSGLDLHWQRVPDSDVLREDAKAGSPDFQMIWVGRNVDQSE